MLKSVLFVCLTTLASLAAAERPFTVAPSYACDLAIADGAKHVTGRMYAGGADKQRIEMTMPQGSVAVVMRRDTKQMHMLMISQKMAMTQPLSEAQAQAQMQDPTRDPNATFTKAASETINGVACDRYDYTSGTNTGSIWYDPAKHVLIRIAGAKGQTVDFTNYVIGEQAATLFEVPADFQAMGGMAGGGMGTR